MKRVSWILFASACVIGCGSRLHPRFALICQDLTIWLLGIWFGLILAHAPNLGSGE